MEVIRDERVEPKFNAYPIEIQPKIKYLRALIISAAEELEGLDLIEETLKWGEPSYLTKHGSTIRIDWKSKKPNQYAMYFKCTSKLVVTFKAVFGSLFKYETTRAIVFNLDDKVPEAELNQCIKTALQYHKIKTKPLLGL